VALAWRVHGRRALSWDDPVAEGVADLVWISDERVHADPAVLAVTVALGCAVAVLAARQAFRTGIRPALFALVATAGVVALTELAKLIVSRPVAEGSGDGSFPSGTATWTLAAAAVLVLLLDSRRARWLAAGGGVLLVVVLAAVVVWERWHYPSDVVGGWLLAGGWVGAAWLAIGHPRSSERKDGRGLLGEHPADRKRGGRAR
jgi:membrane-associated phospholipid phosphatase